MTLRPDQIVPANPTKFTIEAQRVAVEAYRNSGNRQFAAEAAGISLTTLDRRRRNDPTFREAMDEAKAAFVRKLEAAAYVRAVNGVTQRKPGPGGTMYDQTTYSDQLLIHLLKRHDKAHRFDQKHVVEHKEAGSIGLEALPQDAREQIREILLEQTARQRLAESKVEVRIDEPKEAE